VHSSGPVTRVEIHSGAVRCTSGRLADAPSAGPVGHSPFGCDL